MSIHQIYPEKYQDQLEDKASELRDLFEPYSPPSLEVFDSPREHFRMRAEFKVWHEGDTAHYAMYQQGEYKKP